MRGGSWVKKQHFRMLLVSDVTNVAGVWVDACELSLIDLFSLLERHVAASPYICVTTTLPTELPKLSVLWGESKIFQMEPPAKQMRLETLKRRFMKGAVTGLVNIARHSAESCT